MHTQAAGSAWLKVLPALAWRVYMHWRELFSTHAAELLSTLHHTATHTNKLQHTATHCNTLRHTTLAWRMYIYSRKCIHNESHDITLQRIETHARTWCAYVKTNMCTHCNTLRHTAAHCNTRTYLTCIHAVLKLYTLQNTASHCNKLQHTATNCNTLQHTAAHASTWRVYMYKRKCIHTA